MPGDFEYEGRIQKLIPANVRMISGCRDSQTSADVGHVGAFQLPDPAGRAGGACTSALLKVLYSNASTGITSSWVDVLMKMRTILAGDYSQIPQLTSSRKMDVNEPFNIVPEGSYGTRRAVLIGINYEGQQGELSGCINDAKNVKKYLMEVQGFLEDDIVCLFDDGYHRAPTRDNITAALKQLSQDSYSGDVAFVHYSGHGGYVEDDDGDEDDGYDETLIPVDFQRAGQIRDDDLFRILVGAMREGVTLTALMDCCHSGTVLDLPYRFKADGEDENMGKDERYDADHFEGLEVLVFGAYAACCLMDCLSCLCDILLDSE